MSRPGSVPAFCSRSRYVNVSPGSTSATQGYAVNTRPPCSVEGQVRAPTATCVLLLVSNQPRLSRPATHLRAVNDAPLRVVIIAVSVHHVPSPKTLSGSPWPSHTRVSSEPVAPMVLVST